MKKILEAIYSKEENLYIQCVVDTSRGYFSVTGTIGLGGRGKKFDPTVIMGRQRETVCCGCIHDEIVRIWPQLKPVVDMHLCDLNGYIMHFLENGLYVDNSVEYMKLQEYPMAQQKIDYLKQLQKDNKELYVQESIKFVEEVREFLLNKANDTLKLIDSL